MPWRISRHVCLLVVAVLVVGVSAGAASAKPLNAKQRAKIAKQLRAQIRKDPSAIQRRSFLKRASLVNFTLPVTFRLRTGSDPATMNPNAATVDLGTSLGRREVDLGGSLAGTIQFHDSFDGGALGNVDVTLLPSATKTLTTTSIPLVWNSDVWSDKGSRWDADAVNEVLLQNQQGEKERPGCSDFYDDPTNRDPSQNILGNLIFARGYLPTTGGPGLPGYPLNIAADGVSPAPGAQYYDPNNPNIPEGYLEQQPGVDQPDRLKPSRQPGNPDALGGNPSPFPVSANGAPGGFTQPPDLGDTVLRTAPLNLAIAQPGTEVDNTGDPAEGGDPNGVLGSENMVVGKSGGQANLFGNIPGKSYGIDVTASFATQISSIIRIVSQDLTGRNLIEGEPWPAGVFGCRQIYTGYVNNTIPGVRLQGNLKIAPAITQDGHLRIAKATVSAQETVRFPVAACLVPMSSFQAPNNGPGENRPISEAAPGTYTEYDDNLPSPASAGAGVSPLDPSLYPVLTALDPSYTLGKTMVGLTELPVDLNQERTAPPGRPCNTAADRIVQKSAMPTPSVPLLAPTVSNDGYQVTGSGATITVAADLSVQNVSLDVLLGDV